MAFHDIRFPRHISLGAEGGPMRRTQIVTLASGAEERNSPWERVLGDKHPTTEMLKQNLDSFLKFRG
ncbi:DUF2460 domain-containing protein [Parvularcula sp. IMCC14364]|uniref:DUF2460 domain-containing protein n=1 Tax=Parvularcula sp. IMCC14364 TaxID=3067902 RepID=UPI002740FECA|nr:DUF2460 domain-containing protein [Parvularcula sp. IMCC14364]